ncbi:MAG: integrase core domain-containing protein [bacterium]
MLNTTKITMAWELFEAGVPKRHIALKLGVHWETIGIWVQGIKDNGLLEFLDIYLNAKKGPRVKRQVDPILKRWVWEIREREMDCCGQKILYFLKKEHGISLSVPKASKPREVIQMDTVDFGEVFAFTGIDIFSKEADVIMFPSLTSHDGLIYLETSMARRFDGHSDLIQTDGGPEFKDEFKRNVLRFTNRHRIARPYKKNEQSYIESFNRSLRKECLGWIKYRENQVDYLNNIVINYLERYHYHRPHISLGMRPPLERI